MTKVSRYLRKFSADIRGNVTMIVAFSVIPIVAAVGGGLDFANIQAARAKLQDAVDAGAIAATIDPTATPTQTTREAVAKKAFCGNIKQSGGLQNSFCNTTTLDTLGTASATLSTATSNNIMTVTYSATAHVPTYLLGLVGIDTVDIDAVAKSGVSTSTAEVAFVLDNTGSMSSNNKMTYLKSSLDAVLASMLDSTGKNYAKTKVALVPFDTQVSLSNVAGMVDYAGDFSTVTPTYSCSGYSSAQCQVISENASAMCNGNATCLSNNRNYTRSWTSNGNTYFGVFATSYYQSSNTYRSYGNTYYYTYIAWRQVVYRVNSSTLTLNSTNNGGDYYTYQAYYNQPNNYSRYYGAVTYSTPTAGGYNSTSTTIIKDNTTITANSDLLGVGTSNWTGCVIDRTQSYDVTSDAPVAGTPATLYPAAKCATNTLLPVMALTQDIAAARTYAARMAPAGNTNVTIGVQWGMEVLSPTAPFSEGGAFTDKAVLKYMIVLTDGINTQNRWTTNNSQINARLALACTNAKNLGITVFTVRVEQGDSTTLQNCASQTAYYYNLSNADQLPATMSKIMKSIRKVRLTQ
ncbi:von Willebrand factor type A [Asticcacaulis biprosthecium C19]|uniref:von Willebrand factor type A n=1 Tax=Asticcacaulis biprosthecium C19 TaxID=715226 RepID=F4QRK8_9CAUL|nr:pilus assembly protein [Asticcacaulis biprosthecium]EGF90134.1 von Willebrand factor type A [Asticcacaulis biprosthecium C19]